LVHTFALPLVFGVAESGTCSLSDCAGRRSLLFLKFQKKYPGCREKLLIELSWKSFHPRSGRMLGEYLLNTVNEVCLI